MDVLEKEINEVEKIYDNILKNKVTKQIETFITPSIANKALK